MSLAGFQRRGGVGAFVWASRGFLSHISSSSLFVEQKVEHEIITWNKFRLQGYGSYVVGMYFWEQCLVVREIHFPTPFKAAQLFPTSFFIFFSSPNPIQLCSPPFRFACMPFPDLFSSLFFRGPFRRASWQAPPWIASRSNFSWRKMIWEKALSREMYQKVFQSAFQTENVPDYAIYILLSPGQEVEKRVLLALEFK